MSANVNTCALLADVQLAADRVWADSAKQKDYVANVDVANAVIANQTVRFEALQNPLKDNSVLLYWPEYCSPTVASCSDDCTISGSKPGTSCQEYTLSMCKQVEFSVDTKAYRTIATNFEDAVAVSLLSNMSKLDEAIAVEFVNKMETGKGVNAYTGGKGTVNGFETEIAAPYWNSSLFGYLNLVAKKNQFNNAYLVSGENLYEAYFNAQANAANADGKGAKTLFDAFPIYFDLFNIDSTLSPDKATFMLNKNALAFVSKNYWDWSATDAKAEQFGGVGSSAGMRYKIASKNLAGVFYDVIYKIVCSGNEITHSWRLTFNGDIFRNPVGCDLNNTNILKFVCA